MSAACPMCAYWKDVAMAAAHEVERLRSRQVPLPPLTGCAEGGARFWPTDKARVLLDATRPDAA